MPQVKSWSPNRIVLEGRPGDLVTANANPGNYWVVNGERRFPQLRPTEPTGRFRFVLPPSGKMELVVRPPHVVIFLAVQGVSALVAAVLLWWLLRTARRGSRAVE